MIKRIYFFMLNKILLCSAFLFSVTALAERPDYFNDEIDKEYRAVLKHMDEMMPQTDLELAYLPSFYPFSIFDIHATKFKNDKDKQAFTNFNLGVLGSQFLNVKEQVGTKLPNLVICKKEKCTEQRLKLIRSFLDVSEAEILAFKNSQTLKLVQQSAPHVYRVNNTFYSPTQLISYTPSRYAGFVPSADYKILSPDAEPNLMELSADTQELRDLMVEYKVAAITKDEYDSVNVIFGGLSDNHWGVVLLDKYTIPKSGDRNAFGLEYDIIKPLSKTSFYYQTN
ncbi:MULTISPECIES: hypothetical protein [unclassified Pseudoalteromonas]|uniref:hypothetical protein n=1 Tax=unclassified Pseudoalteromonas TaxID=194690 RepID=UPI00201DA61D|nr:MULTISPECIES: hypothetical protein [unclassified Pseudoalteromonas]